MSPRLPRISNVTVLFQGCASNSFPTRSAPPFITIDSAAITTLSGASKGTVTVPSMIQNRTSALATSTARVVPGGTYITSVDAGDGKMPSTQTARSLHLCTSPSPG